MTSQPRHLLPDHTAKAELVARHEGAVAAYADARPAEAVAAFTTVLEVCLDELGADDPATLTVAGNLAVSCVVAGRRRDGLRRLSENVARRTRVLGEEDPRTLTARDALAVAHRLAGDVDDAVALSEQVTAQRSRVLGAAHPDTLTSRMGLVRARAAAGDLEAAAHVLADALGDAESALGHDHPSARALVQCGRAVGLLR